MVNKRLLSLCDESKKWIGMTVLMNWISIICNIAIVVYIGNVIDKLYNNDGTVEYVLNKKELDKILKPFNQNGIKNFV